VKKARRPDEEQPLARPDDQLMREIRGGDPGALGELYDRYARSVWRAVHRVLGSGADADDVVQAVFLNLPEIARTYDGRACAGPWLVGIGARVALRHRRSGARFVRMLASFAQTLSVKSPRDPEAESSGRQDVRVFEAALARLAPKKRAVFTLIELEGLTTEEVAQALEIPAATVRTRLHHARLELQTAIARTRGGS
jgi:RNA polymerase sigma-70 factor (ECF subfamily)